MGSDSGLYRAVSGQIRVIRLAAWPQPGSWPPLRCRLGPWAAPPGAASGCQCSATVRLILVLSAPSSFSVGSSLTWQGTKQQKPQQPRPNKPGVARRRLSFLFFSFPLFIHLTYLIIFIPVFYLIQFRSLCFLKTPASSAHARTARCAQLRQAPHLKRKERPKNQTNPKKRKKKRTVLYLGGPRA